MRINFNDNTVSRTSEQEKIFLLRYDIKWHSFRIKIDFNDNTVQRTL